MTNDLSNRATKVLRIQSPAEEQLPAVVELDHLCLGGLWNLEGYQRELSSPNSDLLIASISLIPTAEMLIGSACLWAIVEEAHITLLMVHPDFRGQSLGELLLCQLLIKAVDRGLERATLEVKASNQIAQSLYYKLGFKQAGCRKGYYKKSGEDALILWCPNLQTPKFRVDLHSRVSALSLQMSPFWQLDQSSF